MKNVVRSGACFYASQGFGTIWPIAYHACMTKGNVRECNCGVTCFNCPLTAETWLETTGLDNKGIFKEIKYDFGFVSTFRSESLE